MSLLKVDGVYGGYGGADILRGVDLAVADGELVVVIGPNGAGKSTMLKAVFGLVAVRQGRVLYEGADITGLAPHRVARRRIVYVPQERNVFPSLSVQENLEMGAFIRTDDYRAELERAYALFPPLRERRRTRAGALSGGERQMLAMGRALMLDPRLVLLDEPTAGLSPRFVELIMERIAAINEAGISVLMVEQNAREALKRADRGYVLVMGRTRYQDSGPRLLANREVAEMFLGG